MRGSILCIYYWVIKKSFFGITYHSGEIRGDTALKSKGGFSSIGSQIALLPYAIASVLVDCSTMGYLFWQS